MSFRPLTIETALGLETRSAVRFVCHIHQQKHRNHGLQLLSPAAASPHERHLPNPDLECRDRHRLHTSLARCSSLLMHLAKFEPAIVGAVRQVRLRQIGCCHQRPSSELVAAWALRASWSLSLCRGSCPVGAPSRPGCRPSRLCAPPACRV